MLLSILVTGAAMITVTACPAVETTPTKPAATATLSGPVIDPNIQVVTRTPAPTGALATPPVATPGRTLPPPLPVPSARPPQLPAEQTAVPGTPGTTPLPTAGSEQPLATPQTEPYPGQTTVPVVEPSVEPYPSPSR